MKKRQRFAQSLAGLGCLVILCGAALHLVAAYPKVSGSLAASNLSAGLQAALRAVFLMIGCMWIIVAIVTLIATFTTTQIRKPIILFCAFALLAQIPIWVDLIGWFVGNEMFACAAGLIACGGLLFPPVPHASPPEERR